LYEKENDLLGDWFLSSRTLKGTFEICELLGSIILPACLGFVASLAIIRG